MEKSTSTISTEHAEMIHDVKPDYYNKHVASCSSDRTIKIFEAKDNKFEKIADLQGHKGPVWQLSWANPRFGTYLASCSYDRKIIIWKQVQQSRQWASVYTYEGHELSVNSVEFAPQEVGIVLAAGSSDGFISIHTLRSDGKWESRKEKAHSRGVNAVSWSPVVPGTISSSPSRVRLASAGCDNFVRTWRFDESTLAVTREDDLPHDGWVRDVAWAPNVASPNYVLATGTQEGKVVVWSQNINAGAGWKQKNVPKESNDIVWRVSWSITGSILAVSSGEGTVTLWRESPDEEWRSLSQVES